MRRYSLLFAIVCILVIVTGCSGSPSSQPPAASSGSGSQQVATAVSATAASATIDPVALLNDRCTVCHSLDRVKNAQHDQAAWTNTVDRMIGKGAQLSVDEKAALIKYLAENFHP